MKKAKDTELEIKIALVEQGFVDIRKRLDYIETRLEVLAGTIYRGLGAWRAVIYIASASGAMAGFVKLVLRQ